MFYRVARPAELVPERAPSPGAGPLEVMGAPGKVPADVTGAPGVVPVEVEGIPGAVPVEVEGVPGMVTPPVVEGSPERTGAFGGRTT